MTESVAKDQSDSRRAQKHRSSRACQSCRAAKTKCEASSTQSACRRCIATSSPCFFPNSRRGRVKGSKNRRTLANIRHQETSTEEVELGTPDDGISPDWGYRNFDQVEDEEEIVEVSCIPSEDEPRSKDKAPAQSGTCTPWNPHRLVMSNGKEKADGQTLTRKLRRILGEFPVEDHEGESKPSENKYQDPLWLIAGLAERGWDLNGEQAASQAPTHTRLTSAGLPPEELLLLNKWTSQSLQKIKNEQHRYFQHGLHGSRCDVAKDLDPIQHGIVTEKRAAELFQAYWNYYHCQWAMLDPSLHTLSFVRTRSALLTTTILALGSTALASDPKSTELVPEALSLHAHAEKLNLIVYETAARSIEIIQAHILLARWSIAPRTRLDEQRWMRAAMIPRMATEIGLSRSRRYKCNDEDNNRKLQANDIRTRSFVIINEYRFFTYSGRNPMDLSELELTSDEMELLSSSSQDASCRGSVALYQLFIFDREVRRRLEQHHAGLQSSISLEAELHHVRCYIEKFICARNNENLDHRARWHIIHDSISCWLLLAILIARKRFSPAPENLAANEQQQEHQQLLLSLSKRLFDEALDSKDAVRTTQRAAIFPVAASIILRLSSSRSKVLRLALRMAGDPDKPYVPTFIREAGNQMLVMLCQNNVQSTSRNEEDICQKRHSSANNQLQPDTVPGEPSNVVSGQSSAIRRPDAPMSIEPSLEHTFPFEEPNLFSFSDLPFLSEWAGMPASYAEPGTFDDPSCLWMNNGSFDCMGADSTISGGPNINEPAMADKSFDNPFGDSYNTLSGTQIMPQLQIQNSDWSLVNHSPTNTMTLDSVDGEVRSAQREALLSAVDRLMQLASLMQ